MYIYILFLFLTRGEFYIYIYILYIPENDSHNEGDRGKNVDGRRSKGSRRILYSDTV